MLTPITVIALAALVVACIVIGLIARRHREQAEEYVPIEWRDDHRIDPVNWLGDYPGRPRPSVERMQYRPRHGALVGVDAYWEPTRAYRIVTGRRRVAWKRIFTPVRVEFSRFRRPPSRLGRWRIEGAR